MPRPDQAPRAHVLSAEDVVFFSRLEETIEAGLKTFVEVGHALAQIRDYRLYLTTHTTFENYCKDRWHFTRQRAHQLIGAAEVARSLSTRVDVSEKALRLLVPLPAEKRREAWTKATALAGGGPVSTKHVVAVVQAKVIKPTLITNNEPKRTTHYEEAIKEAREWMVRWSHIDALAPIFDEITAAIERSRRGRADAA